MQEKNIHHLKRVVLSIYSGYGEQCRRRTSGGSLYVDLCACACIIHTHSEIYLYLGDINVSASFVGSGTKICQYSRHKPMN